MFPQKLGLDGIEIKRAHLVKSNNRDNNTNTPRIIVLKLLRFRTKQKYSKMPTNGRDKIYLHIMISVTL